MADIYRKQIGGSFKLRILLFLSLILVACSRSEETGTSLSIQLPSSMALQNSTASVGAFSVGYASGVVSTSGGISTFTSANNNSPFNALLNPSALSGFNCFAVLVGGGDFNGKGSCTTSDGQSFSVGAMAGGVPTGQSMSLSVKSGERRIILVGFNVPDSSNCRDFFNQSLPNGQLSYPHILASTTTNLPPGNASVTINAAYSTQKIEDCKFGSSDGGSGGYFGSGSDGDLNVSTTYVDLSTTLGSTSGRYLTSINRVNAITNVSTAAYPNRAQIVTNGSWSSSNIAVGDEIMLYVAGGDASSGCGSNIFPGFSVGGVIRTIVDSTTFTMDMFDSRYYTIPAAHLTNSGSGASPTFCRMLAVRVPHIRDLSFTGGSTRTLKACNSSCGLDYTSGTNAALGLLVMRVSGTLYVASGTTADIYVKGQGYLGGDGTHSGGAGTTGWLTGSNGANGNGGGYAGVEGSGGGHGGTGALTNGGAIVGDTYGCAGGTYDASMKCLIGKIFMGGGGGRDTTGGGAGGGIVRLYTNQVSNLGIFKITASGADASALDDAGGAGGAIFFQAAAFTGAGSLNFSSNGGAGNSFGGVGGGGRIHVIVQSASNTGSTATSVTVGTPGTATGASAGSCYAQGITLSSCP